jgi:hypothetical protein
MMTRVLLSIAGVAALCAAAAPAGARIRIFRNEAISTTAFPGLETYVFPDEGQFVSVGPSFTYAPVTFTSDGLYFFDDAYDMPYIAGSDAALTGPTFIISTPYSALGLLLASYFERGVYRFEVSGVFHALRVPAPDDTAFLGIANRHGPISMSFVVPPGTEIDVPEFIAGASAVAEPAAWALMLSGLAGLGATLRRRRTPAVAGA